MVRISTEACMCVCVRRYMVRISIEVCVWCVCVRRYMVRISIEVCVCLCEEIYGKNLYRSVCVIYVT